MNDYPEESAFHENNILPAILITLNRIYDVQIMQMRLQGQAGVNAAEKLVQMHKEGALLAPPPAFGVDLEDDEQEGG